MDERTANEVVVVLGAEGVPAEKFAASGGWSVRVPRTQVGRGLAVLTDYGLPRRDTGYAALLEESGGLVPSDGDERARRAALAEAALTQTLLTLEGVYDARVHAVLPEERSGLGSREAPAAPRVSIVLVVRGTDAGPPDDAVRAIVMGAIQGLGADSIAIVRSVIRLPETPSLELTHVGAFAVASDSARALRATLVGMAAGMIVLAGGLLFSLVARGRR